MTPLREYAFHTLDVFTDRVFGGNGLGLFPDAEGLDDAHMQRIARELNLSETVFLTPPRTPGGTRRVRIFTPAVEVPFAGHPTIGTAWFLAETGAAEPVDGHATIVLEENVGPVPVEVHFERGRPAFARFTTALLPERRPVEIPAAELARMLGLEASALGCAPPARVDTGGAPLAPEMVSCGMAFLIVPVRDLAAAARARLDLPVWERLLADAWTRKVYVVTTDTSDSAADLHVRMYAPAEGVPEDPATGSAAAVLAGYLGARAEGGAGSFAWTVEQGLEMGRPSVLHIECDVADGEVTAVRVGGRAVMVSEGRMRVP